MVKNLCLGVKITKSENEKFSVVHAVQFSSECFNFRVHGFGSGICGAIVKEVY